MPSLSLAPFAGKALFSSELSFPLSYLFPLRLSFRSEYGRALLIF